VTKQPEVQGTKDNFRLFYRASILHIDDDAGLGRLLQKRLERMAYLVAVAHDGEAGLKMFDEGEYDIVVVDYNMPGVNGLQVLRGLKGAVPAIILTGQGDEKIAVEALRLGAADYIIKDGGGEYIELLPSIIDRVMERQQLLQDRMQAREELAASEARYRAIVEDQTELICRFTNEEQLTFANAAFCGYFGITLEDIGYQNLTQLLPRKANQQLRETIKTLTPTDSTARSTMSIKTATGQDLWLQWTTRGIFDDLNVIREYQMVGRDITDLKAAEAALRESEEKNSALLDALPDPILRISRQGICVDLRPKKNQTLNLLTEYVGKNVSEFMPQNIAELMQEHIDKVFSEGADQVFQFELRQKDGVSYQEARLALAGRNEVLAIIRDVTERANLEKQLQVLSIHDSLTGLYNRMYFTEELLRLEKCHGNSVGMIICDIDGLKIVNDNLGHSKGDELLVGAARVIRKAFRDCDAVARIGGDEFAILLPNTTQAVIEEACSRLNREITDYNKSKQRLFLSMSVGAAISHGDKCDLKDVFHQADKAMYNDKMSKGADVLQIIRQDMGEAAQGYVPR